MRKAGNKNMRFAVRYDRLRNSWDVIDTLSAEQTVGAHRQKMAAVTQAEAEEHRWRRFGPGTETFDLTAEPSQPF